MRFVSFRFKSLQTVSTRFISNRFNAIHSMPSVANDSLRNPPNLGQEVPIGSAQRDKTTRAVASSADQVYFAAQEENQ
jgi:hypothetical protein